MKKRLCFVLLGLIGSLLAWSQTDDPILFSVDGTPVHVSEFNYIYSKTNGQNATYSRQSVEEYLDLYVKFKLKVREARAMQLDTISQLQQELAGYRRQLADSYLLNKEVTERLVREAYDRSLQDVDISHILFSVSPDAPPVDTLAAYQQAIAVKKMLDEGANFGDMARQYSGDKSAQVNGGNIGFINVLFPNGFYPLETAAYQQKIGAVSNPIRTSVGYHLLRVNNRRPARGEVEVAHILLRTAEPGTNPFIPQNRIDSIYKALQAGANFEELATNLSQDVRTAPKGGYIGIFGINRFEVAFEDAAFALAKDGDFSSPVQTSAGWHIIKRISRREPQPYEVAKVQYENLVKRDLRFEDARKAMIQAIKSQAGFSENTALLPDFAQTLNDTFYTFRWKAPAVASTELLFQLGDQKVSLGDFANYLAKASRQRMRLSRDVKLEDAVRSLYQEYVEESCLRYEEKQLEKKYPEFKNLMREYEEGILLFEATRILVWDKAAQDTVGLKSFYATIKGKYRWDERAIVSKYEMPAEGKANLEAIRAYARNHSAKEVLNKYNTNDATALSVEEITLEKGRSPEASELRTWAVGEESTTKLDPETRGYSFLKIEKIMPPTDKSLAEARGYIVADYQDFLEGKWVDELRQKYPVKMNRQVLDGLIKK